MKSIVGIIAVLLFVSCNSSKAPNISKNDTFVVSWHWLGNDSVWDHKKAHDSIGKIWAYGDSASSHGEYKLDTIWKLYAYVDTLRDPQGHPVFDSILKQYKPRWDWVTISDKERHRMELIVVKKISK